VETIELLPLKERMDDIAAIFEYYLEKFGGSCRVEESVIELLQRHHWPGNVRELVGVARVLALIARRYGVIHAHDLPLRIVGTSRPIDRKAAYSPRTNGSIAKRLSAVESKKNPQRVRELILLTLAKYHGNKSAAARALGVSRCTLYRRMKDLKIDKVR
jgi:DNA-binding NtrC family response regulator